MRALIKMRSPLTFLHLETRFKTDPTLNLILILSNTVLLAPTEGTLQCSKLKILGGFNLKRPIGLLRVLGLNASFRELNEVEYCKNLAKLKTLSASFNFPRSFRLRATLANANIVSSDTLSKIEKMVTLQQQRR